MPRIQIEVPQTEIATNSFYYIVDLPDTMTKEQIQAEFDADKSAFCDKYITETIDYARIDCWDTETITFKQELAEITFV
jgi:hypothetical protein